MSPLCTWCIAELLTPETEVIADLDAKVHRNTWRAVTAGVGRRDLAVIQEVLELGEVIKVNSHVLTWPVTTWQGSPVCGWHLLRLVHPA
jgi:hypothetical protein